jgi:hypothetical protein
MVEMKPRYITDSTEIISVTLTKEEKMYGNLREKHKMRTIEQASLDGNEYAVRYSLQCGNNEPTQYAFKAIEEHHEGPPPHRSIYLTELIIEREFPERGSILDHTDYRGEHSKNAMDVISFLVRHKDWIDNPKDD